MPHKIHRTPVKPKTSFSISVSFTNTENDHVTHSTVLPVSFTATGASFTHVIVTVPVAILLALVPSHAWYVNVPVPHTFAVGTNLICVPLIVAVHPVTDVTPVRLNTSPSTSVSFVNTLNAPVVSSLVLSLSFTATGVSFTQLIVTVPVAILLVRAPSHAW